jgi:hypothetical protein
VPENIELYKGDPADQALVPTKIILSLTATHVTVIPDEQLEPGTPHTLQASGLTDTFGQVVAVPISTFWTEDDVPVEMDPDDITVTMPNDDGNVTISSPEGAFAPGTTAIVTNDGNGIAVSFTVGNDGTLRGELPASIDDTLTIVITDPFANRITITKGEYIGNDGRTAISPAGGVVKGPGGSELRIPPGALYSGAVFKITEVDPSSLTERPYFPDAQIGSVLNLEIEGFPVFNKEIDAVFPKPPEAPDGAFYYVYRRLLPPTGFSVPGEAIFEVIDHAFVEGEGENARVATASCPFKGLTDLAEILGEAYGLASLVNLAGGVTRTGLTHGLASAAIKAMKEWGWEEYIPDWIKNIHAPSGKILSSSLFILAWSVEQAAQNTPAIGLVRGKILETVWTPGSTSPTYKGIEGVTVFGCDASGQPFPDLPMTVSTSQSDGSYTLWDEYPTEGEIIICADLDNNPNNLGCPTQSNQSDRFRCVTPVQEVVATCSDNTRYYRNQVKATITFPATTANLPPSDISVDIMSDSTGARIPITGFVIESEPLVLGLSAVNSTVQSVEILHQGVSQSCSVKIDPLSQFDSIAEFTPLDTGTYTIRATVNPLPYGSPVTHTNTFRVVAPGGDTTDPLPGERPQVISDLLSPRDGAIGVPTTIFPEIFFTEPVKHIPGNVTLMDSSGVVVPMELVGIQENGLPITLDETYGSDIAVTSLTIQPKVRLSFNTDYTLKLTDQIVDLDDQLPDSTSSLSLITSETTFKTVVPEVIGSTQSIFSSAGIVTIKDHAYVVQNNYTYGLLKVFDVSDPAYPTELPDGQKRILGRPMDLDAQEESSGDVKVVVATGPADESLPSNLRVYRVSKNGSSQWIGATSLTNTAAEGIVRRVVMDENSAYTITTNKGIQVVDLTIAEHVFATRGGDCSNVRIPLNTDAMGFGGEAVVATIPVPRSDGRPAFLNDLKVANLVDGFAQPIVVATGEINLVIVNPQTTDILFEGPLPDVQIRGRAIDVGNFDNRDIAVIVGEQGSKYWLVTVDITDTQNPVVLGQHPIFERPIDVVIKEDLALVGGENYLSIFNLGDLTLPLPAGDIPYIGGRLDAADSGLVLSTMPSTFGGDVPLGGVQVATLGLTVVVKPPEGPQPTLKPSVTPVPAIVAKTIVTGAITEYEILEDTEIPIEIIGSNSGITTATVKILSTDIDTGLELSSLEQQISVHPEGNKLIGKLVIPAGYRVPAESVVTVTAMVADQGSSLRKSAPRVLDFVFCEVQFGPAFEALTTPLEQPVLGTRIIRESNLYNGLKTLSWDWDDTQMIDLSTRVTSSSDKKNITWTVRDMNTGESWVLPSSSLDYGSEPLPSPITYTVFWCPTATTVKRFEILAEHSLCTPNVVSSDTLFLSVLPKDVETKFQSWYLDATQSNDWLDELPAVYREIDILSNGEPDDPEPDDCDNWGKPEKKKSYMHPGGEYEMRSKPTGILGIAGPGHQAIYDYDGKLIQVTHYSDGKLVPDSIGAGSADRVSPVNYVNVEGHFCEDVRPFIWAAHLDGNPVSFDPYATNFDRNLMVVGGHLERYLEVRPSKANDKELLAPNCCTAVGCP